MSAPASPACGSPAPTPEALRALRGADADGRVRQLLVTRTLLRPRIAALARALVERRAYEALGFRCLRDYGRERLGHGARAVREWARVWEALASLPALRGGVLSGEISWSVARRVVALATPETDAACAETVRGRTVRAVDVLLRSASGAPEADAAEAEETVRVRAALTHEMIPRWHRALELARRVAGERLPVWECAEAIAAEALAAFGASEPPEKLDSRQPPARSPVGRAARARGSPGDHEPGLRHLAFPAVRWLHAAAPEREEVLAALGSWAQAAAPHDLDEALRTEVARLQSVDADLGALLREILTRKLYVELGFERFDRYVEERIDVPPRTARRWIRLARGDGTTRAVASALRSGELTGMQARIVADARGDTTAWLALARQRTLRGLEDVASSVFPGSSFVQFTAPASVASVFRAGLAAARRRLEAAKGAPVAAAQALGFMLEHAIQTWEEHGSAFRDTADFERDGWRCTAPGCTARRSLHSHHIVFRSAGGADEPWNRTTLCAFHHLRGVHAGHVRCAGRAPDQLIFALGVGAGREALLVARSGDWIVRR